MNRLNLIQQEQKVADYHVITWRTSHFHHPRNRTDIIGSFNSKLEGGAAAEPGAQQQTEGIGFGLEDPFRNAKWKGGGLGTDGMMQDGTKEARNSEVLSTAHRTQGRQTTAPESVASVMQTVVPEEVYSVVNSARQSVLKIHSRFRQSMAKLRQGYLKQQEKQKQSASVSARKGEYRRQPESRPRGTRQADREEVLSMQAENHYLLDSYDRNGQYSTLGK